jgi:hypothetical protein
MIRLSESDVIAILKDGRKESEVARQFGVEKNTINRIRTGKRWPHVAPEIPRAYRYVRAESLADVIKQKVEIDDASGCWMWKGAVQSRGYGLFSFKRRMILAHRASYEAFVGEIPEGMLIMHACDTPACCNPQHLKPGTDQDNKDDCVKKGRHSRGDSHSTAILASLSKRRSTSLSKDAS